MQNISANEAKSHFGQLLDTARREPVTIEKHGRPVAVILSTEDYNELEQIKLEHLRAEMKVGIDQLDRGESIEVDEADLGTLFDSIKAEGRRNASG